MTFVTLRLSKDQLHSQFLRERLNRKDCVVADCFIGSGVDIYSGKDHIPLVWQRLKWQLLGKIMEMGHGLDEVWKLKITTPITIVGSGEKAAVMVEGDILGMISMTFPNPVEVTIQVQFREPATTPMCSSLYCVNQSKAPDTARLHLQLLKRERRACAFEGKELQLDGEAGWCNFLRRVKSHEESAVEVWLKFLMVEDIPRFGTLPSVVTTNGTTGLERKLLDEDSDLLANLTITTKSGSIFECHTGMLAAQSSVLDLLIVNGSKGETNPYLRNITLDLDDGIVKGLLQFLYCRNITIAEANSGVAMELLEAGHRYSIPSLLSSMITLMMKQRHSWFERKDAVCLFAFARKVPVCEVLVQKSVSVLKSLNVDLLNDPKWRQMFEDDPLALRDFKRLTQDWTFSASDTTVKVDLFGSSKSADNVRIAKDDHNAVISIPSSLQIRAAGENESIEGNNARQELEWMLLGKVIELGYSPSSVWPIKITTPMWTLSTGSEQAAISVEGELLGIVSQMFPEGKLEIRLADNEKALHSTINIPLARTESKDKEESQPKRRKILKTPLTQRNHCRFFVTEEKWCNVIQQCNSNKGVSVSVALVCDVGKVGGFQSLAMKKQEQIDDESIPLRQKLRFDFTIETSDGAFVECHKILLQVCSPVFKTQLEAGGIENETNNLCLRDMNFLEVKALLKFIYCEDASVIPRGSFDQIFKFLKVASKYSIQPLLVATNAIICSMPPDSWNEANLAIMLFLMFHDEEACKGLVRRAVVVLKSLGDTLAIYSNFQKLFKDYPDVAMKLAIHLLTLQD